MRLQAPNSWQPDKKLSCAFQCLLPAAGGCTRGGAWPAAWRAAPELGACWQRQHTAAPARRPDAERCIHPTLLLSLLPHGLDHACNATPPSGAASAATCCRRCGTAKMLVEHNLLLAFACKSRGLLLHRSASASCSCALRARPPTWSSARRATAPAAGSAAGGSDCRQCAAQVRLKT